MSNICDYVTYDPETGNFYCLKGNSNIKTGEKFKGSVNKKGYLQISIKNKLYKAHRLAFILMGVELPEQVDHINHNKLDNRWCNLRSATQQENQRNTGVRKTSSSGHRNVFFRPSRNTWEVKITTDSGKKYFGSYKNKEDAINKANEIRELEYGEFCFNL